MIEFSNVNIFQAKDKTAP